MIKMPSGVDTHSVALTERIEALGDILGVCFCPCMHMFVIRLVRVYTYTYVC